MNTDVLATADLLTLHLEVTDPEVVCELSKYKKGREREVFAGGALRLGVLALRQARGELDAQTIRREGDRLVADVKSVLQEYTDKVAANVASSFQQFLDPRSGVLPQRLESLVRRNGELDTLLARHLCGDGSELARTLAQHVGKQSPIFRLLSPDQADGLLATMAKVIEGALEQHRERITSEFSLDGPDSALSRLTQEIVDQNGKLKDEFKTDLSSMVREFSLDDPDSALSRLVNQVDKASQDITEQFSLDVEDSSLNRMRRELLKAFDGLAKSQSDFQAEVRATLEALKARKEEAARSTRHGDDFQDAVCDVLSTEVLRLGDVFERCGRTTGRIAYRKVGDAVATLSPDSAAPGARIVVEAKAEKSYDAQAALKELAVARENREAEIGIFVFAKRVMPSGLEPITRFGNDLIVVWDEDDATTDIYLALAYSVARALVAARAREASKARADFAAIDGSLLEIRRNAENLEEISTSAHTVKNAGQKIEERVRIARTALLTHVEKVREHLATLRLSTSADAK